MSNCIDKIGTAKMLMNSIEESHQFELKRAIDLIANLVELCNEEIADVEDCSAVQSAVSYLNCEVLVK